MLHSYLNDVVFDRIEYAEKYNITFAQALNEWEWYGPDGSSGLTEEERRICLEKFRIECGWQTSGEDSTDDPFYNVFLEY